MRKEGDKSKDETVLLLALCSTEPKSAVNYSVFPHKQHAHTCPNPDRCFYQVLLSVSVFAFRCFSATILQIFNKHDGLRGKGEMNKRERFYAIESRADTAEHPDGAEWE